MHQRKNYYDNNHYTTTVDITIYTVYNHCSNNNHASATGVARHGMRQHANAIRDMSATETSRLAGGCVA